MQHMGIEPDRASFNIMVDAYGRSGLYQGKQSPWIKKNDPFIKHRVPICLTVVVKCTKMCESVK